MNLLPELLGSKIRAEIFRLLFAAPVELHVRELQRRTGFNDRAIRQELARLERLELVSGRRDGNRLYFRARPEHPIFPEVRSLALKTSGLAEELRKHLRSPEVALAFIFGSVAMGNASAESDIDMLVVGNLSLRQLTTKLREVSRTLGRELNPHAWTEAEFRQRLDTGDHFLSSILAGPRIMLVGTENDLKRLGA